MCCSPLATTDQPIQFKSELMLRVWSLWLLSPDQARRLILAVREDTVEALEQAALEKQGFSPGVATTTLADPEFGRWATLQWGIAKREAQLQWCDWLLQRLAGNPPRVDESDDLNRPEEES